MPSGGGRGVGGRALVIRFHLAHACKLRSLEERCSRRIRHAAPAVSSFIFLFLLTDSKQSVLAVRRIENAGHGTRPQPIGRLDSGR